MPVCHEYRPRERYDYCHRRWDQRICNDHRPQSDVDLHYRKSPDPRYVFGGYSAVHRHGELFRWQFPGFDFDCGVDFFLIFRDGERDGFGNSRRTWSGYGTS